MSRRTISPTGPQAPRGRRRGLAIPLAAGFCFITFILILATTFTRSSQKRQNRISFQALKAHYVTQGALQGALYKFRVLPNEGFDASEAFRGGNPAPLATFLSDVGSSSIAFTNPPPGTWNCEIDAAKSKALNSVEDINAAEVWKHVVRITAVGEAQDAYLGTDGTQELRREEIVKTVEVQKIRM